MNPSDKSNNCFSVMTLNLRFGLADDGPNNWVHRQKSYPELFNNHRPDFLGFQEVNDFQADFLKTILDEYKWIGERKPAPSFWQNNIIFYHKNWACIDQDYFYLSPTPNTPSKFKKSRWPRQCTIGVFKYSNNTLAIANTHFDFDVTVQTKSADLIMKRLSALPTDSPTILIGDFNAAPCSPCYEIFTGQHVNGADEATVFFKNAFQKPYPGPVHGFEDGSIGDHIDWILYRGGVSPVKSGIIRGKINGMYPSDHFPLFAEFNWNKDET